MPSELLTDRRINAIQPPDNGRLEIWDKKESGLILRITPTGRKTWAVQFKIDEFNGKGQRKTKRLTLGSYGAGPDEISLKEARTRAVRAKVALADGIDPAALKTEVRAAAIEEGRRRNAATVAEAVELFAAQSETSPSKWKSKERPRLLRRELSDPYGAKGIGEVTLANLKSRQAAIKARPAPILANRFAEASRAFFKWASAEYEIANPAEALGRIVDETQFERDRYLSPDELRTVWAACAELTELSADFVRVLLLTPQRVSAVASMRFSQVDMNGVWRIPKLQKKQKVADQAMPLSEAALEIIKRRLRRTNDTGRLVFCSDRAGDVPLQAVSKIKARLDAELGEDFVPWRFHDFRRSFATWAASAGVDQAVVRKVLDHGQAVRGLDAIYNRYEFVDEQRDALNRYAEAVCG